MHRALHYHSFDILAGVCGPKTQSAPMSSRVVKGESSTAGKRDLCSFCVNIGYGRALCTLFG